MDTGSIIKLIVIITVIIAIGVAAYFLYKKMKNFKLPNPLESVTKPVDAITKPVSAVIPSVKSSESTYNWASNVATEAPFGCNVKCDIGTSSSGGGNSSSVSGSLWCRNCSCAGLGEDSCCDTRPMFNDPKYGDNRCPTDDEIINSAMKMNYANAKWADNVSAEAPENCKVKCNIQTPGDTGELWCKDCSCANSIDNNCCDTRPIYHNLGNNNCNK